MGKGTPKQQQTSHNESNVSLKGTLIAVMSVGVFILLSWFGLYALFLSR